MTRQKVKTWHWPVRFGLLMLTFGAAFTLAHCTLNGQPAPETTRKISATEKPARRELARHFWRQERPNVLLVYPAGRYSHDFRKIAEQIRDQSEGRLSVTLSRADLVSPEMIENQAIIAVGSPQTNALLAQFMPDLPLKVDGKKMRVGDWEAQGAGLVGVLPFYPSPANVTWPLMVVTACDDKPVLDYLRQQLETGRPILSFGSWGYEVYDGPRRILLGALDDKTWAVRDDTRFEFRQNPETLLETAHFRFIADFNVSPQVLNAFSEQSERAVEQILNFTRSDKSIPKFDHYLYPSSEQKGLLLHQTDQSHVDFERRTVHTILNDIYADNFIGKENELVLRHLLGAPKTPALERSLAIFFAPKWQRKGYACWAARLAASDNLIPLAEVFDETLQREGSPLLSGALGAAFVAFAIERYGRAEFLKKYPDWVPDPAELNRLDTEWRQWLVNQSKKFVFETQTVEMPYLQGFNFAHEGYRIYNGYGSQKATEALEKLADLGSNAIAIIPYGYMPDPHRPTFIRMSKSPGAENDESVIATAAAARKIGLMPMLKPQIWLRHDSWPGAIEMTSDADWEAFFRYYHYWIAHYALLAEIHQIPLFCLGVEFAKATLQRPDDWRVLARKIRKLYSGKLTYAANWGEEFEKLTFWDQFDFIGLNCYYPLGQGDEVPKTALKAAFDKVLLKAEQIARTFQKPIVFTEIGFRSIPAPWEAPHAGNWNDVFNGEHQKRCYEVVFEGIQGKSWCQGILWWKFPSYLNHQRNENGGFTPNNKPAEAVVRSWFSRRDN
ncbi:MAG: hypothetical protein D6714_11530 [Bacteroidetes bacterium]|nr:MAG: hypothetical protein D6714_11530 [Bacteroidota bacterium]